MVVPSTILPVTARHGTQLASGWSMLRTSPGACPGPQDLPEIGWQEVRLPTTVSEALGSDCADGRRLDSFDWWFRCELPRHDDVGAASWRLRFEGLATLVDVWVDGRPVLSARNMHRSFVVPLDACPRALVLRCTALLPALQARRARPRWKTALVDSQSLRWFRTTLLGRVSSWSPRVDVVGPWRPCHLEYARDIDVEELLVASSLRGDRAVLRIGARWRDIGGGPWTSARIRVGDNLHAIESARLHDDGIDVHDIELDGIEPWWPHTHGHPALHRCVLHLRGMRGELSLDLGEIGFKSFAVIEPEGALSVQCNGRPLFLRGACWTAADLRRLDPDEATLQAVLARVVAAGMNMLRIVGTAVYPSESFYAACDRLGILVWQDFMFANLDYPLDDPAFAEEAQTEARELLQRSSRHACLAVYCGGSEVEQQAAMLGLASTAWSHPFFDQWLPSLLDRMHPGSAYLRSSPSGGELPFHPSSGVCHYYGVGAYRRPLADARLAGVRMAAECLGFSNVPSPIAVERRQDGLVPVHDPRWKAGVPRDAGAGWDFEDIRDHYFSEVLQADPREMRMVDPEAYLRWSGLVSGEIMAAVYSTWRAPDSGCQGALVWWLRDLAAGAGWGVLDCASRPKPAYWALKRCLAPRAVLIDDRGLEGCDFLVLNDRAEGFDAVLTVELWQAGRVRTLCARRSIHMGPRCGERVGTVALFGHFVDINHAYRFGPPSHDTVIARLTDETGTVVSEATYFPSGMRVDPISTSPQLRLVRDGTDWWLHLRTDEMLLGVEIDAPGHEPEDNCFHLAPGIDKRVRMKPDSATPLDRVHCTAANLRHSVTVRDG